jgi:hypothetical protein
MRVVRAPGHGTLVDSRCYWRLENRPPPGRVALNVCDQRDGGIAPAAIDHGRSFGCLGHAATHAVLEQRISGTAKEEGRRMQAASALLYVFSD